MIKHRHIALILAALMLFLQSVTLTHAVEHAYVDHSEICKVYSTAEKHGAVEFATSTLITSSYLTTRVLYSASVYFSPATSAYSPRAPPLT